MTKLEQLALIIQLACLTEDRTRSEQAAVLAWARRVDRDWNVQMLANPRMPFSPRNKDRRPGQPIPACTFSVAHEKRSCPCRGRGFAHEPDGGWSRLTELAAVRDVVAHGEADAK